MRNKIIIIVIVVAALAVGVWAFSNNKSNSSSSTGSNTTTTSSSTAPVATNMVSIANMAFSPTDITVKKGTTVTWTNQDSVAHTVTENDGKNGPSAPPLDQGKSYSFTYNQTGTFRYHCSIHPSMTGTVTVTE